MAYWTRNAMPTGGEFSVVYCTNIWNHYQASWWRTFHALLGSNRFNVLLLEPVPEERRSLGWDDAPPSLDWVWPAPKTREEYRMRRQKIVDADVAILGACPNDIRLARADSGKLTFITAERSLRKPVTWLRRINPIFRSHVSSLRQAGNHSNVHFLAIGKFAPDDAATIGVFGDRVWSWAYFADVNPERPRARNNPGIRLLWAGRMLDWKRVDCLIQAVASVALEPGFDRLDIVGAGPERKRLLRLAEPLVVSGKVRFHDPVPPARVIEMMRQADIYVLPSGRSEGWGVVANEAMSEGAVLVINEQAGAAEMVQPDKTGFLFSPESAQNLSGVLTRLIREPLVLEPVRASAWESMRTTWHPEEAARRLAALCTGLLGLGPIPVYPEGPCRNVAVKSKPQSWVKGH